MSPDREIDSLERDISSDVLVSSESLKKRLVKTIVISGPSYSGKDTLAAVLGEKYGVKVEDGKEQFERRTGVETGHMKRKPEVHRRFDLFQSKIFRKLTGDMAGIWQTRLGGVILAEERDNRLRQRRKRIVENQWAMQRGEAPLPSLADIPAVSVLVIANDETRLQRAYIAALRDSTESGNAPHTVVEIKRRMDERAQGDVTDWAPLHPKYVKSGQDPFDRNLKRQNGAPIYDIVINTSEMSVEEETFYLEQELEKFDAFEKNTEDLQDITGVGLSDSVLPSEIQPTLSIGEPLSESR